ncbi:small, acid-soluble spore protein, alpha/beta type [Salipaludibacillus sp. HK11]|uniref:small, acid-soluble spore protein, alpha/beta type n=1 Tax=Salipaludibacillus sp. HK11 TaxID=3394320 RepID=UPI0039FD840E
MDFEKEGVKVARRNKILVPGAREVLDQLKARLINVPNSTTAKYEVAKEQGIQFNKGDNGNIKARDAGKVGGSIGGNMVREMVKMAEHELINKKK